MTNSTREMTRMMISNRLYATTLNGRAMDGILLRGGEERRDVIVAGPVGIFWRMSSPGVDRQLN